jgi:hypothetical protein
MVKQDLIAPRVASSFVESIVLWDIEGVNAAAPGLHRRPPSKRAFPRAVRQDYLRTTIFLLEMNEPTFIWLQ